MIAYLIVDRAFVRNVNFISSPAAAGSSSLTQNNFCLQIWMAYLSSKSLA